ncbi:MAG: hypothetical protein U5L03_14690 [Burkholderiaceae bacterium]|nr:hypothetical protein [Burkholderiaceae bacterium]
MRPDGRVRPASLPGGQPVDLVLRFTNISGHYTGARSVPAVESMVHLEV